MRLFIAVPIPENIKLALKEYTTAYSGKEIKFVPVENLHLTLHFIGEYPTENLEALKEKLTAVATELSPFNLNIKELAPGPKLKNPRLIWARFEQEPAFKELSLAVCEATNTKPDHPEFIPHITFARFKKNMPVPTNLPEIRPLKFPDLPVTSFAIWESTLGSPHPVYKILVSFELGQATPENL